MMLRSTRLARGFSTIKRAKPIRVKKSESRRVIPEAKEMYALTQAPTPLPPANPFLQSEQQAPTTFGGVMKESFLWGVGMAAAFSVVGIIFSRMEENIYLWFWHACDQTNSPGDFRDSIVVVSQDDQY